MRKTLAVLLSITLLLSSFGFAVSAAEAEGVSKLPDKITENEKKPFSNSFINDFINVTISYNVSPDESGENLAEQHAQQFAELMGIVLEPAPGYMASKYNDRRVNKRNDTINIYLKKYEVLEAAKLDFVKNITCNSSTPAVIYASGSKVGLLIRDNTGWDNLLEYALDKDGNELCENYPGYRSPGTITDVYGETFKCVYVPVGAEKVILNNGYGKETVEITDFSSYDGYELKAEKDENGKYLVVGFTLAEVQIEPQMDPADYPETVSTFYLENYFQWEEAYITAKDSEGNELYGAFPGKKVTEHALSEYGFDMFVITVPKGAVSVSVNNGVGLFNRMKTEDITGFTDYDYFWFDEGPDQNGVCYVKGNKIDTSDYIFKVTNNLGWDEMYVYAVDNEGNEYLGEWPGTKLTETSQTYCGETDYLITVPYGARTIFVNDGKSNRTANINAYECKNNSYCKIFNQKDESGNYKAYFEPNYELIDPDASEIIAGDVNGDNVLDVLDAVEIQKNSVEKIQFTDAQKRTGDYNKDGNCDVLDAVEIQKALVAG